MCDTFQLIDKLVSAVSFKFKDDGTSPNVTISKLRHGYYCSVVRYTEAKGKKNVKVVVCNAQADSLEKAVTQVVASFLKIAQPETNPLLDLQNAVSAERHASRGTLDAVGKVSIF